ncbi:MAG: carbamoyltransferase C-terminal domain-containing protein [Candidatus Micrarchaeia archaeon]
MYVLGIWDGHDAGAALIRDNAVVYAANEERFTKRKLEIGFPRNSIKAALAYAGISPTEVKDISYTTTEFSKTLERLFPGMKESYYKFRRRAILKPRLEGLRHIAKYSMTSIGILPLAKPINSHILRRQLSSLGFENFHLHVVEHHLAHAASAAFTSGFGRSLVITLDGLGDGLSGTVNIFDNGRLERQFSISAKDSIGIFYEQVTNLVGMRELEDEGKVMAMADYSYPFDFKDNRFKDFFKVENGIIKAKYGPVRQYDLLSRIAWQMPREQFSYMAQQLLEVILTKFVESAIDNFGIKDVSFAGGLFSNVKANMKIRELDTLSHWYVFPHMGDGGLALGSALYTMHKLAGYSNFDFNAFLGNSYTKAETIEAINSLNTKLEYEEEPVSDIGKHAADIVEEDNYIFWFQGRMEYGPRALGNRSIIARSDSEAVKEKLNMYVKKREWFQPFAPAILEEDADRILEYDNKGTSDYMTMAYKVREEALDMARSVMHVDKTARPQIVRFENPYTDLLRAVKKKSGYGIALNTSFNLHGKPIVMDPADALNIMLITKTRHMFINGIFVTNPAGV